MRRVFSVLLCLCLLLVPVSAAEKDSLPAVLSRYIEDHGLTEENFAISCYNTVTGESYSFNQTSFFPAGRVWTLPLQMYYCQEESLGTFDPPENDPFEVFTIDGRTLDECRAESVLRCNEEVENAMLQSVGSFGQFQTIVNDRFGHVENPPEIFLEKKYYSSEFLLNCLRAAAQNPEVYGELMRNYAIVQTSDAFNGYARPFSMTQIRGEEENMICAVAEVTAPQTYLVAGFASREAGGDQLLADINTIICTYVEEQAGTAGKPAVTEVRRSDSDFRVAEAEGIPAIQWVGIALGGAAVLALLAGLVVWLVRRKRRY